MRDAPNETTVPVACDGSVTIPEEIRDSLGLDGTGRVAFVETENGEVAIRRVKRPAELRGALARSADGDDGECPSVSLREERRRDSGHVAEKLSDDCA